MTDFSELTMIERQNTLDTMRLMFALLLQAARERQADTELPADVPALTDGEMVVTEQDGAQ